MGYGPALGNWIDSELFSMTGNTVEGAALGVRIVVMIGHVEFRQDIQVEMSGRQWALKKDE